MSRKVEISLPLVLVIGLFSPPYNDPRLKCHSAYLVFSHTCWSSQPSWLSHSRVPQHAGEMVTRAELNTCLSWGGPRWWKQCPGGCNVLCADKLFLLLRERLQDCVGCAPILRYRRTSSLPCRWSGEVVSFSRIPKSPAVVFLSWGIWPQCTSILWKSLRP